GHRELRQCRRVLGQRVRGGSFWPPMVKQDGWEKPLLFFTNLDARQYSASGDIALGLVPCISFDHKSLVDIAVDHLALCEPKSLVYLQFVTTGIPIKETRKSLFEDAAARHGIPARSEEIFLLESKDYNTQNCQQPLVGEAAKRLREVLKSLPRPSAIWCGDDVLARRVCEVASELGLRIPHDLAVLGLGNFRSSKTGDNSLSTIPLSGETIGYRAISVLEAKLSGDKSFPDYIPVVAPAVMIRDSTLKIIDGDPVSRALAMIADQACENLSVRKVAEELSMSPQSLHSRFVERIGRSPGEEIRRVKLAQAQNHLRDPQMTIASIATHCDYSEQNKFSNFFKRETGLSPSRWRSENV
ncbi:MAG: helix-turn-helix domain-containing protein, partial [Akkermansiaceae bacterium]|nr:helix-turn-helix domain-containing protein [Akkermansiaceae bacterium]